MRASAARALLARGKTQKFPIIFICGSPTPPHREAEYLKGRKFLVLPPPLHFSKKACRCILAFLPILRPPFLRRLRRPEAPPVSAFGGSSIAHSHFASTSHWPLTFVRDACSVLFRVRSVASVMFAISYRIDLSTYAKYSLPNNSIKSALVRESGNSVFFICETCLLRAFFFNFICMEFNK